MRARRRLSAGRLREDINIESIKRTMLDIYNEAKRRAIDSYVEYDRKKIIEARSLAHYHWEWAMKNLKAIEWMGDNPQEFCKEVASCIESLQDCVRSWGDWAGSRPE